MATIEDYYEELGKFGHLGQTYSLNIIKELKDATEKIEKYEQFLDDANLCYECGHSDRTCNHI